MKKFLFLLLTILIVFACADKQNTDGKTDVKSVKVALSDSVILIRKTDTLHLAFPDIIKKPDSGLIVVYREGLSHVDSTGKILAQSGYMNGENWSLPFTLIDDPYIDDRDPSLTVVDDKLFVNYFKYMRGNWYEKPTICHIHTWMNNPDDPNTSKENQIDSGLYMYMNAYVDSNGYWVDESGSAIYNYGCSSGSVIYQNRQIIAGYGGHPLVRIRDTKEFSSPVSRIKFFEKTSSETPWQAKHIAIPNTDTLWLQEPALLNVGQKDTLLVMHLRTAYGKSVFNAGHMAQTVSTNGHDWSPLKFFPFIGHSPDLFQSSSGIIFCGFRMVNDAYIEESVAFIYSNDGCITWSEPVIVEHCGEEECGYPSFEEIAKNEIIMVYYGDNGTAIKARKIFITEK